MKITPRDKILEALSEATTRGLSGAQLAEKTKLGSGVLYPELQQLEKETAVRSKWVHGPYPRRRLYYLPDSFPTDTA